MKLQPLWDFLAQEVFPFSSTDLLWNPYQGENPELDQPDGAKIRQNNLHNYLASFDKKTQFFLVGEAPGPWGCRFSGVPFTSERALDQNQFPFQGRSSSRLEPLAAERSGTILWETLIDFFPNFLVWNCIPYHPTKPGEPLSIRTPKKSEILQHRHILQSMIEILKPKQVIAIGRKAEQSLQSLGIEASYVRHPSHGGSREFKQGMQRILHP
jgi:uracil-DNA glycosylase